MDLLSCPLVDYKFRMVFRQVVACVHKVQLLRDLCKSGYNVRVLSRAVKLSAIRVLRSGH